MQITPIACLTDNYAYIINNNTYKIVGVVDPSEASPVITFLKKKNLKLNYILNTHHHYDHIGGNVELKKLYNAKVVGFAGDKHRIPGIDITLEDNSHWSFGDSSVKILHIPGHTLGHICFFFEKEKIVFTGDTLFSLGCGRIFEGDHKQMLTSLNKIKKLPGNTKIYCGHEYTLNNYKFLKSIFDNHKALNQYKNKIDERLKNNMCSIPFMLGDEKVVNPFLVSKVNSYKYFMKINNLDKLNFFKHLRSLKDDF